MLAFSTDLFLFAQQGLPETSPVPTWVTILAAILVFVVPFILGAGLARLLGLKDVGTRIGIVLCVTAIGITPFVWQYVTGHYEQQRYQTRLAKWTAEGEDPEAKPRMPAPRTWRDAINLGIDLAGGTNLVYEVDERQAEKEITNEVMDQMIGAIGRRINPSGTEEVVVRRVGGRRIEVIIPGADPELVRQKKSLIQRTGSLEFAILANQRDHAEVIAEAQNVDRDLVRAGGRVVASWRPVGKGPDGQLKDVGAHGEVATRTITREGQEVQEFLVVFEEPDRRVTGTYLSRAYPTNDEQGGLAVGFTFNTRGAFLFQTLTSKYRPRADGTTRRLAILLDGQVHSAPNLQAIISDSGQISGRFTKAEIDELVNVLNAGALEVPLKPDPVSEQSISPLLGHDVQTKGIRAIVISSIVVFVFMAAYYLFAGLIACACLFLNMIIVLGAMALIDATFTLPGLAGLVLTIGMAVDANVLIYERMREEVARGSSIRMAIQNGFDRALSAIIDSNVTTLIIAVVLYMIGTDQVKGFAVTLFIGIVASMFTAIYFGRLVFDVWERKGWLKNLKMFSLIGKTQIDFLKLGKFMTTASLLVIAIGSVALFIRGEENLDIDFTGGTMVTFEFDDPQVIDEVRSILQQSELGSSISLEQLQLFGRPGEGTASDGRGTRFRLRTTETNVDEVRRITNEALTSTGHDLRRVTVEFQDIAAIPENPQAEAEEGPTVNAAELGFAGGQRAGLTFNEPLKVSTAEDYFARALSEQNIENPRNLFEVEGTKMDREPLAGEVASYSEMVVRVRPEVEASTFEEALTSMRQTMAREPTFDEINTFDSAVATEMQMTAIAALLISTIAIIGYLWFRFENVAFGIAATACTLHDALFAVAVLPMAAWLSKTALGPVLMLDDFKLNLTMVAAIMTLIGYSLNDTIVIFDRIREVRGKNPSLTADMINLSVNQTLARTILTTLTTLFVVIILYVFGGEGIHGFAFLLLVGMIVGVYSTIFIASPLLLWLMKRQQSATGRPASSPASGKAVAAR